MPAKKSAKKRPMSDDHKQALAEGRTQGKAVRAYLSALETTKKPAGRKPQQTPEEVQQQIDAEPDPAKRLELIQRRIDLEARAAATKETPDLEKLEADFVEVAKPYAERRGITYSAFRELGVPAKVLKDAGIPQTRRRAG